MAQLNPAQWEAVAPARPPTQLDPTQWEEVMPSGDAGIGSAGGGASVRAMPQPQTETIMGEIGKFAREQGPGLAGAYGAVTAGAPLIAASGPAAPLTAAALGTAGYTGASLGAEELGIRETPPGATLSERAMQAAKEGALNEAGGLLFKGAGAVAGKLTKPDALYEAAVPGAIRFGETVGHTPTPAEQGSRIAQGAEGLTHSVPIVGQAVVESPKATRAAAAIAEGNRITGDVSGKAALAKDLKDEIGGYLQSEKARFAQLFDAPKEAAIPPSQYSKVTDALKTKVDELKKKRWAAADEYSGHNSLLAKVDKAIAETKRAETRFANPQDVYANFNRVRQAVSDEMATAGKDAHEFLAPLHEAMLETQIAMSPKAANTIRQANAEYTAFKKWGDVAGPGKLPDETAVLKLFRQKPERFEALAKAAPDTADAIGNTYLKEAWLNAVPQAAGGAAKVAKSGFRERFMKSINDVPETVLKRLPPEKVQLLRDATDFMEVTQAIPMANRSKSAISLAGLGAAAGAIANPQALIGVVAGGAAINSETAGQLYRWLAVSPVAQSVKNRLADAIQASLRLGMVQAGARPESPSTETPPYEPIR